MAEQIPADLIEASVAAREYGIPYTRLRYYWTTRLIGSWIRGRRRLVSREQVERVKRDYEEVRPAE